MQKLPQKFIRSAQRSPRFLLRDRRVQDQQLKCFDANRIDIFTAYATIAALNPKKAIDVLLQLEKSLKPNAQASFWNTASSHIPKSLKDSPPEHKEFVYRYILDHAHKGQISSFITNQADYFGTLLTKSQHDTDFIGKFLDHATPNTAFFLETFKPQFEAFYNEDPKVQLGLTKKLLKACSPFTGKDKKIAPPAYVQKMQLDQIKRLIRNIATAHDNGDAGFKRTNSCLQELETLKACTCEAAKNYITSVKPANHTATAGECHLHLYQINIPAAGDAPIAIVPPRHLYILAGKPKGYSIAAEGGILNTILVAPDLHTVAKSFASLGYSTASKKTVAKMVDQLNAPYQIDTMTGYQYTMENPYPFVNYQYSATTLKLNSAFQTASQLTDETNGVSLSNVHESQTQYRDILSVQHH